MNIFFLHLNPQTCAQFHCNKHVVKMILETAQLLWTCFQLMIDNLESEAWRDECPVKIYRPSFRNHPMCIWTRKSISNYKWLLELGMELCKEYMFRYEKVHSCQEKIEWLWTQCHKHNLPSERHFSAFVSTYKKDQFFAHFSVPEGCTKVPVCMPEELRHNNLVSSYRHYYIESKASFAKWKKRNVPKWFEEQDHSCPQ